jgi:hypothetical protein
MPASDAGNPHLELVLKGPSRRTDEVLMYLAQPKLLEGLDTRRTFAVEFSKTGAAFCTTA